MHNLCNEELNNLKSNPILCRQDIFVKCKPNPKNTFAISKFPKNSQALGGKSVGYFALDEIIEDGIYKVLFYATTHNIQFRNNILALAGQFYAQNTEDEDDIVTFRGIALDHIRCAQCFGRGYFMTKDKKMAAEVNPQLLNTFVAQKNMGRGAMTHPVCTYNHHYRMGCNGTGVNQELAMNYQELFKDIPDIKKACEKMLTDKTAARKTGSK